METTAQDTPIEEQPACTDTSTCCGDVGRKLFQPSVTSRGIAKDMSALYMSLSAELISNLSSLRVSKLLAQGKNNTVLFHNPNISCPMLSQLPNITVEFTCSRVDDEHLHWGVTCLPRYMRWRRCDQELF